MLFFLLEHVSSTWWDWNIKEFNDIMKGSIHKPLFVLCYSPYCPHCHGLPEGIKAYSEGIGNRSDIYITSIDCMHQQGCHIFGITGTPTILLVMGKRARYWQRTRERGAEGWDRWINETMGPNLRRIYNDTELKQAIAEPTDGGTTFVLEVPSEDDPSVETVRSLSRSYRLFNDTFVYIVDPEIKSAKITAHTSEYCSIKYNGKMTEVRGFLEKHKFGTLHRYDTSEFRDINKKKNRGAIYFTDRKLNDNLIHRLKVISKGHCDMIYGWANVQDDQQILKSTEVKETDIPLMYKIGSKDPDSSIYKGRVADIWNTSFLTTNIYKGSKVSGLREMARIHLMKIKIVLFLAISIAVVYFVMRYDQSDYNERKLA